MSDDNKPLISRSARTPGPAQAQREDYVARINRVLDTIDRRLDERLDLDELASVASFSRFHFHRLFSAFVGEPLNRYVTRLRLERAAARLVNEPKTPVTAIALDSGFSSPSTFARAFQRHFEASATEWREQRGCLPGAGRDELNESKIGKGDSNERQALGKLGEACTVSAGQIDPVTRTYRWRIDMPDQKLKAEVEVKEMPREHVAYVRHVGPYAGDGELFGRLIGKLMAWAGPRRLFVPGETKLLSIYHDDPDVTDDAKLRLSVGITVPEDTDVDGEIGKLTLEGGLTAVARFELDPEQYGDAWQAVYAGWLPESGYRPDDRPSIEVYVNDPNEHPERKHIVDICVPVVPA